MEEMMAKVKQVIPAEQAYVMPEALKEVLRPMSQAEAEEMTVSELKKFWRRPLIGYEGKSPCPCCGRVKTLKTAGLCGGCYNRPMKNGLSGLTLLNHMAEKAAGIKCIGHKKMPDKIISPALEPGIPKVLPAQAMIPFVAKIISYLQIATDTPMVDLPEHVGRLVQQRDMLEQTYDDIARLLGATDNDCLPLMVGKLLFEYERFKEQIETLRALNPEPWQAQHDEQAVVAKWSALPIPDGYEELTAILHEAIDQAATGKGYERHANGKPFNDQPILRETEAVGMGFPAGQARKKILEALRCCDDHPERAVADLLGAINYTAALVIAIRAGMEASA
jgi:hypothetical protein